MEAETELINVKGPEQVAYWQARGMQCKAGKNQFLESKANLFIVFYVIIFFITQLSYWTESCIVVVITF